MLTGDLNANNRFDEGDSAEWEVDFALCNMTAAQAANDLVVSSADTSAVTVAMSDATSSYEAGIKKWSASATVTATAVDDTDSEDETVTVTLELQNVQTVGEIYVRTEDDD